jgi:SAM-dependent methyltransferase
VGREEAEKKDQHAPLEGSIALIPPLLARASGVVLDIGPGSGTQMPLLCSPAIKTIYGPEPCLPLHEELHRRVLSAGLEGKYHILPCSAERSALVPALRKCGVPIEPDSRDNNNDVTVGTVFDTIICIRVLCSVPDPDRTIADLYDLLRPGGQLLVVEHVVNPWLSSPKGSIVARLAQSLYSLLGWSFFVGDCRMNRDTTASLKKAAEKDGGWETFDLEPSFEWSPLSYISGVLVKRTKI